MKYEPMLWQRPLISVMFRIYDKDLPLFLLQLFKHTPELHWIIFIYSTMLIFKSHANMNISIIISKWKNFKWNTKQKSPLFFMFAVNICWRCFATTDVYTLLQHLFCFGFFFLFLAESSFASNGVFVRMVFAHLNYLESKTTPVFTAIIIRRIKKNCEIR